MIGEIVYLMCAFLSIGCAVLLIRGYRKNKTRLLLWSSLCFALLAVNNVFLMIDLAVMPNIDLLGSFYRNLIGATSGGLLLYGLIWELT